MSNGCEAGPSSFSNLGATVTNRDTRYPKFKKTLARLTVRDDVVLMLDSMDAVAIHSV